MENEDLLELAIGAENLRRMFRQTMANNAWRSDETLDVAHARLMRDPGTARVAKTLGCTVAELLEGFGQDEVFYVEEGYDRASAEKEVAAIVEKVASAAMGTNDPQIKDSVERSQAREQTPAAPHVDEERGRVLGDEHAQKQIALARNPFPKPRNKKL